MTGKVDGDWTKRISKNGGAFAAMTVTITEMENGWYSFPLSTSHSDTLGILSLSFSATGVKRVNLQYRVHAQLPDDHATAAALATMQADTDDIQTRLPAALVSGRMDASVGTMAANVLTATAIATDAITAAKIAADAIGASELAADAVTEIQAGLATAAALATVQADTDDLQARLPAALVGGRMDASVGAMAADVVTAAAIATDAIGSAELAASAVTEIQAGLATSAAVATVQADTDDIQTRLPTALVGGRMDASVGAMAADVVTSAAIAANAIGASEFAQAAADKVFGSSGAALAELAQGIPPATPRPDQALMALYMALRNLVQVTATEKRVTNDAGTVIFKKALTDDGTTYAEAEAASGP